MFTGIKTAPFFAVFLLLSGCANIVIPHTRDFNATAAVGKSVYIEQHTVTEPFTDFGISATWSSKEIKAATEKAGISKIAYMDEKILSIFLIYQRRRLLIYGE